MSVRLPMTKVQLDAFEHAVRAALIHGHAYDATLATLLKMGATLREIVDIGRTRRIVAARHAVWFVLVDDMHWPQKEIERVFGVDSTTVGYALQRWWTACGGVGRYVQPVGAEFGRRPAKREAA